MDLDPANPNNFVLSPLEWSCIGVPNADPKLRYPVSEAGRLLVLCIQAKERSQAIADSDYTNTPDAQWSQLLIEKTRREHTLDQMITTVGACILVREVEAFVNLSS
jgi:hypothetical protein